MAELHGAVALVAQAQQRIELEYRHEHRVDNRQIAVLVQFDNLAVVKLCELVLVDRVQPGDRLHLAVGVMHIDVDRPHQLETAHALAYAEKLAATMTPDQHIIVNLSGRGDKDILTVAEIDGIELGAN